MLGLGYDIQLSQTTSVTPFLNGVAITLDDQNPNFLQVGFALTIH